MLLVAFVIVSLSLSSAFIVAPTSIRSHRMAAAAPLNVVHSTLLERAAECAQTFECNLDEIDLLKNGMSKIKHAFVHSFVLLFLAFLVYSSF